MNQVVQQTKTLKQYVSDDKIRQKFSEILVKNQKDSWHRLCRWLIAQCLKPQIPRQ